MRVSTRSGSDGIKVATANYLDPVANPTSSGTFTQPLPKVEEKTAPGPWHIRNWRR